MQPRSAFRLRHRNWYPWLFLVLCLVAVAVHLALPRDGIEGLFPAFGLVGGFVAFLYTQHLQESRLFNDLFMQFNRRYDEFNAELNAIRVRQEGMALQSSDEKILVDYFNLCAEEFLFFKAGYIDLDVWRSWCRGMQQFTGDPEIRTFWEAELRTNSYYGFTLEEVSQT